MSDRVHFRFSLPAAVWLTFFLLWDKSGGAVYSICAAAFHECGHLLLMWLYRDRPKKITFGVYGMRIEQRQCVGTSYAQTFWIAFAGPLSNLLLGTVFLPARNTLAAAVNFALALFNLLPIRPMDGGQMLYALLCRCHSQTCADRVCKKIAVCGLIPLTAMGVYALVRGGNYSLFLSSLYVVSLLLP